MRLKTGEEVIFRSSLEMTKLIDSINQNILFKVEKPVTMLPVENKVTFVPWVFSQKMIPLQLVRKMYFYFTQHKSKLNLNIGE